MGSINLSGDEFIRARGGYLYFHESNADILADICIDISSERSRRKT